MGEFTPASEYVPLLIAAELMDEAFEVAQDHGWRPIVRGIDKNGADLLCDIGLTRPVGDSFSVEQFDRVAEGIGLRDETTGRIKDGYRLGLESPRKSKLMGSLGYRLDPRWTDVPCLTFAYEGVVDGRLLLTLDKLVFDFNKLTQPEHQKGRLVQKLGTLASWVGQRKQTS